MQHNFSCTRPTATAIQASLSASRLHKYLAAAKGDLPLAIRLYIWNSELSATFYSPIQIVEVAVRNAIAKRLRQRFGASWHSSPKFRNTLNNYQRTELTKAVSKETRQHRHNTTSEHIISALTLGFWTGLMSAQMDKQLWAGGIAMSFPHAPAQETRASIHQRLDSLRAFRNDVMHYRSIFDKSPRHQMQRLDNMLGYICEDSQFLLRHAHNLEAVISNKPR
ncbi:Abi family protein [Maricaulis maris]|uniref:Abi-like protein n=1 Tax=Maricaulis maris TaxID=74318 RepID=A0A495D3B4_9PROT|nr:Abi family protein [Maricaulis maris]RKQ96246.1 Abi-like protein [Maricaulis maris]